MLAAVWGEGQAPAGIIAQLDQAFGDPDAASTQIQVASFHPEDFGEVSFSQIEYCGP